METKTPSREYAWFQTGGNGADEMKKGDVPVNEPQSLSKNAARKLARYERVVAARKAKRREKKQARKKRLAAAKELESFKSEGQCSMPVRSVKKEPDNLDSSAASGVPAPCICIDMGHTELMSEKELNKLSSQLRRLYGSNRHSCTPLKLYFTNFPSSCRLYKTCVEKHQGFERYSVEMRAESHSQLFPKESLLYLSPDAPEALPSTPLESNTVYVIGGLVDETVHKTSNILSEMRTHTEITFYDTCKRLIYETDTTPCQAEVQRNMEQAALLEAKMTELRSMLRKERMSHEWKQSDNAAMRCAVQQASDRAMVVVVAAAVASGCGSVTGPHLGMGMEEGRDSGLQQHSSWLAIGPWRLRNTYGLLNLLAPDVRDGVHVRLR
ncbi:hypothetical protein HPB51_029673 [Rhipicephalus microplus]|uniref:SAM-dependent MTase TRM10-type domain-containing protein n=1 Tax=Rhipicephalus microplus TaxID=6941 RepID=A0A9J6CTF3_RHIMP|nr:hypothetical protein HPB51_029673 [Rhipicephalus microplus]